VIQGKRNLTKESVFKFSMALKLTKGEGEYFENLVFFNQAKTLEEKNAYLAALMKFRGKTDPRKIESSEFDYYSAWYHPVIRELCTSIDFRGDYRRLGRMVIPPIPEQDARKSVELLARLDFVRNGDNGLYARTAAQLTTGAQVRSVAVANYHAAMMRLASESIQRFGAQDRDITSLTLRVSDKTRAAIVERLKMLRREILDMEAADRDAQRVMQLNLQLFPLSQVFGDWGRVR
jgi:uncharacterized protein (TIGR02147 family)